jgi:hypothetical protein
LPLLIQVLAGFTKVDGRILEDEIDSSLGFLRYDYPEAVYSELRAHFKKALNEPQDLSVMAKRLAEEMSQDKKIMLGVELYDLIARAGMQQEQVIAYYSFMAQLGMAAQAIDIVYQLNAADMADPAVFQKGTSPLESLIFGSTTNADVQLKEMGSEERLMAYRYHDLILLKNLCGRPVSVQGRALNSGEFCRPSHPRRRTGDQPSGPSLLLQCEEERLDAVHFRDSQFQRRGSIGKVAYT